MTVWLVLRHGHVVSVHSTSEAAYFAANTLSDAHYVERWEVKG